MFLVCGLRDIIMYSKEGCLNRVMSLVCRLEDFVEIVDIDIMVYDAFSYNFFQRFLKYMPDLICSEIV